MPAALAATVDADGASGLIALTDGDTCNYSIELPDAKFPLMVRRYGLNVEGGRRHRPAVWRPRSWLRLRDADRRGGKRRHGVCPAFVEEATSATLVLPGEAARVDPSGVLVITERAAR